MTGAIAGYFGIIIIFYIVYLTIRSNDV